jgi:hypothetical protein
MRKTILWLASLALLSGCSKGPDQAQHKKTLTQAERDSLIARSPLPGAPVVGRALAEADSARARKARMDRGAF